MKPYLKWTAISLGSVVAIAHIGVLGHLVRREPDRIQVPTINIPRGTPYSSYKIEAGKDGYTIEYKANDPAILESQRSLHLDQDKKGLFGGKTEQRREWRRDQYTAEGVRNIGGAGTLASEGKSAKDVECIVADAGARSQGAMAGSAVATGVLVPAVVNVPYIGWLAAGWAALLGQNIGSAAGSQVNSMISDC
ncbi:hypothetical protein HOR89_gp060 [Synechococcus phage Bellamy]|uniref:Uncharacterized protein n=1 Tax=Synechococcus phage Bellamy TaxID=2023996 RepID=A0A222YW51_9CAUD|nr:hypothetical protein HOR89_gp060 [Synechococcus phage Bellamy]ASR76278.1 hypothetical protein PBI_BELLAMY_242 [Synechococcus phage Bellamy]